MPTSRSHALPSDSELHERAANQLKRLQLFRGVSRRLLIDLVRKIGVHTVLADGPPASLPRPALLVVVDGVLRARQKPRPVSIWPGAYLPFDSVLRELDWKDVAFVEVRADGDRPARFLALAAGQFDTTCPQILVNQMDPTVFRIFVQHLPLAPESRS